MQPGPPAASVPAQPERTVVFSALCFTVYRLASRCLPHGLSPSWRDRMVDDFRARLDESAQRNVLAMLRTTAAALADLFMESLRRAVRPAGHDSRRLSQRGGVVMENVWSDVRHTIRGLLRAPAFTLVMVVTLALAIGANTTLFSVVRGVLLRPMPYAESEDLYQIVIHYEDGSRDPYSSFPDFVDTREQLASADRMTAFYGYSPTFTAEGTEPLRLQGLVVSTGFFETLELSPALGHFFTSEDVATRNQEVVVVGHGLWQGSFGSDPGILGRSIELNGATRTVIGVGPEEFPAALPGVGAAQLFVPLEWEASDELPNRGGHNLNTLVRLRDDVPPGRAEAELDGIMARLRAEYPDSNNGKSADLEAFREAVVGNVRPALVLLLGGVGMVLLIAVANVTAVLLGRAADRERELGLRTALGAGKARIYGQLAVEGVVLACVGGLIGVALAYVSTGTLVAWLANTLPRTEAISVDPAVLLATTAVTTGAGLLMGLIPAWSVGRSELMDAIRDGGVGKSTSGRNRQRLRKALVVSQIGLCLTLLTGSGLLIRSLGHLNQVDIGVNTEILSFGLHLPMARYAEWPDHDAFHGALEERLEAIPGIGEVASINGVPLSDVGICGTLYAEEDPTRFEGGDTCAQVRSASGDYFEVMGIPVLQGRVFDDSDDEEADLIVINQATADLLWPGESPLGRRIMTGFRGTMFEVIGVVANVKQFELSEAPLYQTYVWDKRWRRSARTLVMPFSGDLATTLPLIRRAIWSIDALLPPYAVRTMDQLRNGRLLEDRIRTILLASMSALALVLAVVGIYGVISYSVSKRRREMAIRMSVGAESGRVRGMVLKQALGLVVVGIAVGTVGGVAFGRALGSFLYQVDATSPGTMVAVSLLLATAGLVAAMVPARRATRVDPMLVLREE